MELSAQEEVARAFAIERHGSQRYGEHPYVHHLSQVRSVLERFGHQGALCTAAWLHDVLEDTPTTREEIVERFGAEVEQLVWAVTGVGPNRKARNASMYEKVRAFPLAATLKLADRIANVEASLAAPPKFEMYRAELPHFREQLAGLGDARMWNHLERLFKPKVEAENTAARVALWRALHVLADPKPHVLEDEVGLKLLAPPDGWQQRPDMSPFTRPFRASILARARFIEDLVAEQVARGVGQYVILGAGLDTFAQRRPELASRLTVFEVDQPGPQEWKRQRLVELGFGVPPYLKLVPVDFEAGEAWWNRLAAAGFDAKRPAVVVSTGVSMYLTREANAATLRQVSTLAPGSTFVMSFLLPIELAEPEARVGMQKAAEGARASGTPFISFFTPEQMLALARENGFRDPKHVSAAELGERYFAGRADGLRPPKNSEELLLATT